jgi:hypothetical protein
MHSGLVDFEARMLCLLLQYQHQPEEEESFRSTGVACMEGHSALYQQSEANE